MIDKQFFFKYLCIKKDFLKEFWKPSMTISIWIFLMFIWSENINLMACQWIPCSYFFQDSVRSENEKYLFSSKNQCFYLFILMPNKQKPSCLWNKQTLMWQNQSCKLSVLDSKKTLSLQYKEKYNHLRAKGT